MYSLIICLASQSPRRKELLERAGHTVIVRKPHIDDAQLRMPIVSPRRWIMSLAYLKARSVLGGTGVSPVSAARPQRPQPPSLGVMTEQALPCEVILAADTVCVVDDHVLGQPKDAEHARAMLVSMRNRSHTTMTGICLLSPDGSRRLLATDTATVTLGNVSDAEIEQYITTGEWRGKAGAYNLEERIQAGWPIECTGDPATVMGLPVKKLPQWLGAFMGDARGGASCTRMSP
jgi:septum formation protein